MAWPTLQALLEAGGPVKAREIEDHVASALGLTAEQRAIVHSSGRRSEFRYRLGWARTQLKAVGAARPVSHGVWEATAKGRGMTRATLQGEANDARTQGRKDESTRD